MRKPSKVAKVNFRDLGEIQEVDPPMPLLHLIR